MILSKNQEMYHQYEIIHKKINIKLVIQNTHKLTITFKQKKEPYFKTLYLTVLYKPQNWLLFYHQAPAL